MSVGDSVVGARRKQPHAIHLACFAVRNDCYRIHRVGEEAAPIGPRDAGIEAAPKLDARGQVGELARHLGNEIAVEDSDHGAVLVEIRTLRNHRIGIGEVALAKEIGAVAEQSGLPIGVGIEPRIDLEAVDLYLIDRAEDIVAGHRIDGSVLDLVVVDPAVEQGGIEGNALNRRAAQTNLVIVADLRLKVGYLLAPP